MLDRGIDRGVATVLTQVEVDPDDPAFSHPTKPIGAFMTEEEADRLVRETGLRMVEDAGRGLRRVVASPEPRPLWRSIRSDLWSRPTTSSSPAEAAASRSSGPKGNHLKGAAAVIDKDFAAAELAKQLDADLLIILTAVEKVAIHFGKPDQQWLDRADPGGAEQYIADGRIRPGSMLPKVEAALDSPEKAPEGRR